MSMTWAPKTALLRLPFSAPKSSTGAVQLWLRPLGGREAGRRGVEDSGGPPRPENGGRIGSVQGGGRDDRGVRDRVVEVGLAVLRGAVEPVNRLPRHPDPEPGPLGVRQTAHEPQQ